MEKEMICIVCPRGCHLKVKDQKVEGNFCPRGEKYALSEITCPQRMLTSTVKIEAETLRRLPVITSKEIAKDMMFKVMEEINKLVVKAPIKMHQVLIENVLDTGADIIATREILK